jgi:NAD(P) transhydrogenase
VADYDLVVIGSGPAGEKSKNLRETALSLSGLKQRDAAGVRVSLDRDASLTDLLCRQEPILSAEIARVRRNLEAHRVALIAGHARFVDPRTLRVEHDDGTSEHVTADVFLIATGSTPYRPADVPWDHPAVHDSDGILHVERIPESLTVAVRRRGALRDPGRRAGACASTRATAPPRRTSTPRAT